MQQKSVNGSVEYKNDIDTLKCAASNVREAAKFLGDDLSGFADHSVGEDQDSWDQTLASTIEDYANVRDALKAYHKLLFKFMLDTSDFSDSAIDNALPA